MKLSEKFTNRNLDGMFKLILLFHGDKKKYEKICVKIYVEEFKEFHNKFDKKWVFATGLEN